MQEVSSEILSCTIFFRLFSGSTSDYASVSLIYLKYSINHTDDSRIYFIFAASNYKIDVIMSNLQVIIYLNHDAFNAGKKVFERMVSYSEAVHVDFVGIANTLRFLFGSQSIVSFNIF